LELSPNPYYESPFGFNIDFGIGQLWSISTGT
jgi:hypothetical protein